MVFERFLGYFEADCILGGGILRLQIVPLENEVSLHIVRDLRIPHGFLEILQCFHVFHYISLFALPFTQGKLIAHVNLRVNAQRGFQFFNLHAA